MAMPTNVPELQEELRKKEVAEEERLRKEREEEAKENAEREAVKKKADEDRKSAEKADFEAKVQTPVLRQAIACVAALVDECRVSVKAAGIDIDAVDPAHVAMIQLHLDRQAFESFEMDDPFAFVLDVEKFKESIKHVATESLTLGFKSSRLYVRSGNLRFRQGNLTGNLEGIAYPKVPNLRLPATFVVPRAEVVRFLKLEPSDHLRFIGWPAGLDLWAEGQNEDDVVLSWQKDELEIHECKELLSSEFPSDYFWGIVKTCPAASFRMKIGNDYPIKMSWTIGKADSVSDVHFLLAPRIPGDDDAPGGWKERWQAREMERELARKVA